ncbi:2,3-diaminopropionate biosynthesis protein SbnB [Bacillus thuringiensis]|uniref:2,3-diaminopropionate biosynthesis protein SbnB n=1 Tax=Bacillus tropicus TaxID=2026188 RepID=UPI0035DFDC92
MLYLNDEDVTGIGVNWKDTTQVIEEAVKCFAENDVVQPIKPYLRFKDLNNRIIAMPAYVGKSFDVAGIKWIASFPDNIHKGIPRANSVVILNDTDTGQVKSIINGSLISIIRTTSVSALMIKYYLQSRKKKDIKVGISGWGPIGQYHYKMLTSIFRSSIKKIAIYDIDIDKIKEVEDAENIQICSDWREAYDGADVFITCTVSENRYINQKPKEGSLLLNISLRDYTTDVFEEVKRGIIVDNWKEVCREKTDIEMFHLYKNLSEDQVYTLEQIVCESTLECIPNEQSLMFNPMGMSSFDIAIGEHFYRNAKLKSAGKNIR